MAREATGTIFECPEGHWRARCRWNGHGKSLQLWNCSDQTEDERHAAFIEWNLTRPRDARPEEFAPQSTETLLDLARRGADAIAAGGFGTTEPSQPSGAQ